MASDQGLYCYFKKKMFSNMTAYISIYFPIVLCNLKWNTFIYVLAKSKKVCHNLHTDYIKTKQISNKIDRLQMNLKDKK